MLSFENKFELGFLGQLVTLLKHNLVDILLSKLPISGHVATVCCSFHLDATIVSTQVLLFLDNLALRILYNRDTQLS